MRLHPRCAMTLLLVGWVAAPACAQRPGARVERPGEPTVYGVAGGDSAMNAAMATARQTLDQFTQRLAQPPRTQTSLSLKVRLAEGAVVEHVWLIDVRQVEGQFSGVINDVPVQLRQWHAGDTVRIGPEAVSDWLAIDDGRLVGGFTIRVLRDRMGFQERARFDAELPFRIEN